jgi:hypothetical protein
VVAAAIDSVQRPAAKFAVSSYGVVNFFALGVGEQYHRVGKALSAPVFQQWLRQLVASVPFRPTALVSGEKSAVAGPRDEVGKKWLLHTSGAEAGS